MATKHEFLAKELDKQIAWFDRESTKHKTMHRRFRGSAFVLTATATVLAGLPVLSPPQHTFVAVLLLLVTSVLTVINSFEGLRKPAELWIHERTTLYRLYDIRRDLDFGSSEPGGTQDLDALYDQLQETLQSSRDHWGRLVGKPAATKEKSA